MIFGFPKISYFLQNSLALFEVNEFDRSGCFNSARCQEVVYDKEDAL
jgi:hypothetical protein